MVITRLGRPKKCAHRSTTMPSEDLLEPVGPRFAQARCLAARPQRRHVRTSSDSPSAPCVFGRIVPSLLYSTVPRPKKASARWGGNRPGSEGSKCSCILRALTES